MEGRLQFANQAWAKMHGYTPEELLGRPLSIGHTKEQLENDVLPFNKNVLAHGSWAGEVGHVRKDGTTFLCWMSTVLLHDSTGKPTGLVGIADDITERRKAERQLRELGTFPRARAGSVPAFKRVTASCRGKTLNVDFNIDICRSKLAMVFQLTDCAILR